MKKAYSHLAILVLAAASFSSCSRANYASMTPPAAPVTTSIAQVPTTDMSAEVVATKPQPAASPEVTPAPAVAVAPVATPAAPSRAAAPVAKAQSSVAVAETPAVKATKPTLVQRLALNKITKQLNKIEKRQQNTASVTQTAASSGSLTILLVGLVALLVGIIIGSGFLTTVGSIVAVVGLVLLLLKAL
ncbi:hypothetical protein FNT36_10915 [Hymenobacter setariae]|uniref:Uncharacterized protein n=1 Tax=Hymenobacter setariae TaxID=2594794 RepID=A0A558BZL5_9BACT|nr:hypothetical protein [Hymenobacter setariae]TVT41922.1 hypothetical protein FNT36_10915 [Hymenobacter setariae]